MFHSDWLEEREREFILRAFNTQAILTMVNKKKTKGDQGTRVVYIIQRLIINFINENRETANQITT